MHLLADNIAWAPLGWTSAIGWIICRLAVGYVYLFALYKNVADEAARKWLLDHTAYLFPGIPEPRRTRLARWAAITGMVMMFMGGVSVLFGIEFRGGAFLLFVFTAGGIYQHRREREVAMEIAAKVAPDVPAAARDDFATLQWSAFSGHFSSGLKNWGLCGLCGALMFWPCVWHQPILCDYVGIFLQKVTHGH